MLGKIFSQREAGQQESGEGGGRDGATPLGRCLFWNFHSRQSGDAAEAFDNANVTWAKNRQGSRAKVEEGSVGGEASGRRRLRMRKACDAGSLEKYREDCETETEA